MVMRANSDYLMRVTLKNPAIRLALGQFDELTTEGIIRHDADPVAGRLFAGGLASAALMTVLLGEQDTVQPVLDHNCTILTHQSQSASVTTQVHLPEEVSAPVDEGQKLGEMIVYLDGEEHERVDLVASTGVARLTVWGIFQQLLDTLLFLPTHA